MDIHEHLAGLLGSVGKSLAASPQARQTVEDLKAADTRDAFVAFLEKHEQDLGVDTPACDAILDVARDRAAWQDTHALLLRSAEQQLIERFSPSS